MSRNLKRVPINFDWPLHKIWSGYVNPYYKQSTKCPDCENGYDRAQGRPDANAALFYDQWYGNAPFDPVAYGAEPLTIEHPSVQAFARRNVDRSPDYYAPGTFPGERALAYAHEAWRLFKLWRGQWCHHLIQEDVDALVEAERLWYFTHVPRDAGQAFVVAIRMAFHDTNSWLPEPNGYRPTAAEVNAWSIGGMGHDSLNCNVCVKARCEREGVPSECVRCAGTARIWPSPEIEQKCEDWKKEQPPAGDGYQLWEDCSEGSPVSPVFGSLEELCAWAADNATTFGSFRATAEEWKDMLKDDRVHATDERGNIYL